MRMMLAAGLAATIPLCPAALFAAEAPNLKQEMMAIYCGKSSEIAANLADNFGERMVGLGQVDEKTVVAIYATEAGGFTFMIHDADGGGCMVAAGDHWTQITPKPAKPSSAKPPREKQS